MNDLRNKIITILSDNEDTIDNGDRPTTFSVDDGNYEMVADYIIKEIEADYMKKTYLVLLKDRLELEKEKGLVDFHATVNPDCKDREIIAKGLLEIFEQRDKLTSKPEDNL